MSKSTSRAVKSKMAKPYPGFPLFAHATKRWAKKIRGKLVYFGPVTDDGDHGAMAALGRYQEQASDLHAGRTPRVSADGATIRELCNRFCSAKEDLLLAGEIVRRTYDDYFATCETIIAAFGRTRLLADLDAADFRSLRSALAKRLGPVSLGNEIQRIRTVFKFAYDEGLLDRPVRYGQGFQRPHKRVLRKARAEAGPKMLEPAEIKALIAVASSPLRAMILLGANCGLGNADCGKLPMSALDLESGWLNYARPKTGIDRRCPLWPETVAALREALADRPAPKDAADGELAFITKYGKPWYKESCDNPVSKEFTKLRKAAGIERKAGFYHLRHVFETIGGDSGDQLAVNSIMGHADGSMAAVYRERISDERLRRVTDHIHEWLFASEVASAE